MELRRVLATASSMGIALVASTACGGLQAAPAGEDEAVATAPCGAEGLIDDGEDGNNQVAVREGRSGYWYTYADEGSTVTPTPGAQGGTFAMAEGGANGSGYAARMQGRVGTGSIVYAGLGFSLLDPKDAYDASRYGGIRFYARRGGGSDVPVRVKLPDRNTDPDGGRCQECFNDFGAVLNLTETWTEYVLAFASAVQDESWGDQFSRLTPSAIYSLQWQVNSPGADFDVWVDDIAFTGCSENATTASD